MMFRILWAIDALITLIVVYFFFVGLADGSVSSFNIGLWSVILLGLACVMVGTIALRSPQRRSRDPTDHPQPVPMGYGALGARSHRGR
jgi:hypothetical protein